MLEFQGLKLSKCSVWPTYIAYWIKTLKRPEPCKATHFSSWVSRRRVFIRRRADSRRAGWPRRWWEHDINDSGERVGTRTCARVRTAPSNSSMNERERLIKAALTAGGAAAAASWNVMNNTVSASTWPAEPSHGTRYQGRLRHINDGANAPWKNRGKVFAGT